MPRVRCRGSDINCDAGDTYFEDSQQASQRLVRDMESVSGKLIGIGLCSSTRRLFSMFGWVMLGFKHYLKRGGTKLEVR